MGAKYTLFLRNWINGRASVEQINQAVTLGYITQEEAETIMATEQNPL